MRNRGRLAVKCRIRLRSETFERTHCESIPSRSSDRNHGPPDRRIRDRAASRRSKMWVSWAAASSCMKCTKLARVRQQFSHLGGGAEMVSTVPEPRVVPASGAPESSRVARDAPVHAVALASPRQVLDERARRARIPSGPLLSVDPLTASPHGAIPVHHADPSIRSRRGSPTVERPRGPTAYVRKFAFVHHGRIDTSWRP